ncbi:uncharacterized protein VTP21DRAFT_10735 [Calcarisporiella thermophila]|uniref:uncharacterized protein n=1 Tax=Calcarisporiella thermophila TaxID=911321 RepID=UPI0037422FCC
MKLPILYALIPLFGLSYAQTYREFTIKTRYNGCIKQLHLSAYKEVDPKTWYTSTLYTDWSAKGDSVTFYALGDDNVENLLSAKALKAINDKAVIIKGYIDTCSLSARD